MDVRGKKTAYVRFSRKKKNCILISAETGSLCGKQFPGYWKGGECSHTEHGDFSPSVQEWVVFLFPVAWEPTFLCFLSGPFFSNLQNGTINAVVLLGLLQLFKQNISHAENGTWHISIFQAFVGKRSLPIVCTQNASEWTHLHAGPHPNHLISELCRPATLALCVAPAQVCVRVNVKADSVPFAFHLS